MRNILRRLRGIFGSAIAWGSTWFAGGFVFFLSWGLIGMAKESRWDVLADPRFWYTLLGLACSTAAIGAVTGGAFAIFIAANFRNNRLEDLSPGRFALGGGLVTILLSLVLVSTGTPEANHWLYRLLVERMWVSFPVLGMAGAALGFTSLKLAQRSLAPGTSADELESGSERLLT